MRSLQDLGAFLVRLGINFISISHCSVGKIYINIELGTNKCVPYRIWVRFVQDMGAFQKKTPPCPPQRGGGIVGS